MTTMPYGLGVDALTIKAGPCTELHKTLSVLDPPETPHIEVSVTTRSGIPVLDAMLDSGRAQSLGSTDRPTKSPMRA